MSMVHKAFVFAFAGSIDELAPIIDSALRTGDPSRIAAYIDANVGLLSDPDEALCAQFDVIKMKNMYGKKVRGIERSTFVVDKSGKLAREWRGVKVPGHAEEVLDFVKTL